MRLSTEKEMEIFSWVFLRNGYYLVEQLVNMSIRKVSDITVMPIGKAARYINISLNRPISRIRVKLRHIMIPYSQLANLAQLFGAPHTTQVWSTLRPSVESGGASEGGMRHAWT